MSGSASDVSQPAPISTSRAQQLTVRQPIAPWPVIYGSVRAPGIITYISVSGSSNEFLNVVITLAGHEVKAINALYFDGNPVSIDVNGDATGTYSGYVYVEKNLGTADQAAFPGLIAQDSKWTSAHTQSGRAGIYVRLKFSRDVFPNGLPNITVDVLGHAKVYDPRTSTRGFTDNAALCLAEYLTNATYGVAADIDTEFSSDDLIEAANTCDEIVDLTTTSCSVVFVPTQGTCVCDAAGLTPNGPPTPLLGDKVTLSVSGGTLPAGLSTDTAYYWIPSGAIAPADAQGSPSTAGRHGQLAASLSDAMAGTPVDFAGTGSGTITLSRVGEPRYRCDGTFTTDQKPSDVIPTMLTAMGGSAGRAMFIGGQWVLHAGAYRTPTVTLTDADVRKAEGFVTLTTVSRRESFNAVKGVYLSPANAWQQSDYPAVTSATYQALDDDEQVFKDFNLPFTTSAEAAQRIATMELNRARREITVPTYPAKLTGFQVQAGDTVMITNDFNGWDSKVFDVTAAQITVDQDSAGAPIMGMDLSLREIDSNAFDWSADNATGVLSAPKTNLPDPTVSPAPGVPTVTESLYQTRDGAGVKSKAVVSFAAPSSIFVAFYQVEYKLHDDSTWTVLPRVSADTSSVDILDVKPAIYDFRVKAINSIGVSSDYATVTKEITGLGAIPSDPTNLSISPISSVAILHFDASPDLDVRIGGWAEFRHASALTGATWDTSVSIGEKAPGNVTQWTLPLVAGTYLMKWVDSGGNRSSDAASVATNAPSLTTLANLTSLTEDSTFGGTKTSCAVVSSKLQLAGNTKIDDVTDFDTIADMDLEGGIASTGTYLWSSAVDLGSKKQARATLSITAAVVNTLDQFDNRSATIDDWQNFDGDLTSSADAVTWIRYTDDDPAGTSPTWSGWQRLHIADFNARGFDLKTVLSTEDAAYNIEISALSVSFDS